MVALSSSAPATNHQPDNIRSTWQNFHAAGVGRIYKAVDAHYKTRNINHACLPGIDRKPIIQKTNGQFIHKAPPPDENICKPQLQLLQQIPESKGDYGLPGAGGTPCRR